MNFNFTGMHVGAGITSLSRLANLGDFTWQFLAYLSIAKGRHPSSRRGSGERGQGSVQLNSFHTSSPPFAVGLSSSMSDLLLHNGGNCLSPFDLRWPLERGHLVSAVCACKHRQSPVFNSFLVRRQIGSWTHATKKSRQTRSNSVMSVAK